MVNRVTTRLNDGTQGLFVSKPGIEVTNNPSPWDLVFDSRVNYTGSVVQSGTATRGATISFPTLPYVPMVLVYIRTGSKRARLIEYRSDQLSQIREADIFGNFTEPPVFVGGYYPQRHLVEPIYKVTRNSITFVNTYASEFDPSGGYTATYAVLRVPGGT